MAEAKRPRPGRREVDPVAQRLMQRHGAQILATARRYSATREDAEDAYQRGLEILLTKAPVTDESELVPWLRTVVKHEAFAIRRQRERATPTTDDGELGERPGPEGATHEQAERYERLRLGAEALRRLKPQEVRCLQLRAQGYSYQEICELTGWTYTKVNRCLTEGRRSLLARVAGIESGGECLRLEPMLSALADGEASAADVRALRLHMRSCLACRARLRELRSLPARVAVMAPPAVAVAYGGGLRSLVESLVGAAQQKAAVLGERVHATAEVATGQKVAAVAASAAAIAGGGAAVETHRSHLPGPARVHTARAVKAVVHEPGPRATVPAPARQEPVPRTEVRAPASPPSHPPPPPLSPPPPSEFAPAAASTPPPTTAATKGTEFGP
jgi:RNA polymerase sigma factor (sigma-70 family)